jgi:hypothetical protein
MNWVTHWVILQNELQNGFRLCWLFHRSSPCLLEVIELEKRLMQLGQARTRSEESKKAKKFIVEQLLTGVSKRPRLQSDWGYLA